MTSIRPEELAGLLRGLRSRRPETPAALWQFVRCYYGLAVPRRRCCPHHVAPFEYVAASFFQLYGDLVIWANRGGAKTELGSITTHLDSIFHPDCQTRILGGSLQQSERMYQYLGAKWHPHFADYLRRQPRKRLTELRNGASIEILPQSERSVRGQRVQRMKCDEVDEFDPQVWRAAQFVTRSTGTVRASLEAFSTMHRPYGLMSELADRACNVTALPQAPRLIPEDEDDDEDGPAALWRSAPRAVALDGRGPVLMAWCLWETIERCPAERSCSRCPLNDDCQGRARRAEGFIPIDDAIAQMRRSGREAWESEMLCLRPRRENLVFPRFERRTHVQPLAYDSRWPTYRTLDFGFANPFVCLWAQVVGDDPETAAVRVLDEYVQSQRTVAEHAVVLQGRPWPVRMTFCDPAGRQRGDVTGSGACQELARLGIPTRSASSGIVAGVELVRARLAPALGPPRLVIDPRCRRLVKALESYHYPDGRRGPAELPDKDGEHDHLIDALRYLVFNLFGRGQGRTTERSYW